MADPGLNELESTLRTPLVLRIEKILGRTDAGAEPAVNAYLREIQEYARTKIYTVEGVVAEVDKMAEELLPRR
jgi:hypothetical protein